MDFDDALLYMSGLLRFGWKLGNERFEALCERLGNPQDKYRIVHVAGTKGKGSTTALAAAILHQAGYNVGGYFSPYVYDVCERVQVNGAYIPREAFARLVTLARPHIEALAQTELGQTTEFELKTLLGFLYFAERKVDFASIEVGLGGRLDATNLVKPTVTVITNIGLDHIPQLGDTHAQIAGEKAGIIKPGIPCFTATDHPDALEVITRIAQERNAPLFRVLRAETPEENDSPQRHRDTEREENHGEHGETRGKDDLTTENTERHGGREEGRGKRRLRTQNSPFPVSAANSVGQGLVPCRWAGGLGNVFWSVPVGQEHTGTVTIHTLRQTYQNLEMKMGGIYQRANAACAVAAAEEALAARGVALPEAAVRTALATTALPGRLSIVRVPEGPLVVLDGAHNELAAQSLSGPVGALREQHAIQRLILVIGMLDGHEPEGVLAALAPQAERIFVCQPQWKRALPADELARVARKFTRRVKIVPDCAEAARAAIAAAGPKDLVLVTGSFYTVGEVPLTF